MVLTTQSATKVYRTPDSHAHQRMTVRVGADAVLEHLPDQLIAYRDAVYVQDTVVDLDPTASYVTAEVVTPGWAPDGTLFRYEEVRLRQEIRVDGRIAVVDNLIVRPGDGPTPVASALVMDGRTHVGTLLAVDRRIDADLVAQMRDLVTDALSVPLETLPHPIAAVTAGPEDGGPPPPARVAALPPLAAVTSVDGPGLAVRVLGTSTEQVNRALFAVVDALRERWRGQVPVHLRKY
jgi:urease accessory protein